MTATDPDRLTLLEHGVAELEIRLNTRAPGGAAAAPPVLATAAPTVLATGAGSAATRPAPASKAGLGPPPARPTAPMTLSTMVAPARCPRGQSPA